MVRSAAERPPSAALARSRLTGSSRVAGPSREALLYRALGAHGPGGRWRDRPTASPGARRPPRCGRPVQVACIAALATLGPLGPLGLIGCAEKFPRPFYRVELAEHDTAPALVHYLSQRGASAAACGRDPAGLHVTLAVLEGDGARVLARSVLAGRVEPHVWIACMRLLFERSNDPRGHLLSRALLEALGHDLPGDLRKAPERYTVLLRVYGERPARFATDPGRRARVMRKLARAIPKLSGEGSRLAIEAQATLEVESGLWRGQPITPAVIDERHRSSDRRTLALFSTRLADRALRREAARRIVRMNLFDSEHRELRGMAAEVEEAVLRDGVYAVPLDRFPVVSAQLAERALGQAGFELGQDALNQVVVVHRGEGALPATVPLRRVLWLTLRGLARPVTLCPATRSLDPTPCVAARELDVAHPRVRLGADGALAFPRWKAVEAVRAFTRPGSRLAIPLRVGGRVVATLDRPVRWRPPTALWFHGPPPGGDGPYLYIQVYSVGRVRFDVQGAGRAFVAIVEAEDVERFTIGSRGARGAPGQDGSPGAAGSNGWDGSNASCPHSSATSGSNGGDGGPGSPGGPGGPGGKGGNIDVRVRCAGGGCAALRGALRRSIYSMGGPGGAGGRGGAGGPGGRGGRGGSGASCTDSDGRSSSLSSGSDGRSGWNGAAGANGAPGEDGVPGHVHYLEEAAP